MNESEAIDVEHSLTVAETSLATWDGAAQRGLEAREQRQQIIKRVLVPKKDFGTIPGCGPKPVLLKAGAEKIVDSLNLWPDFKSEEKIEDFDKPLFFYRYRCTLRSRGSDVAIASGLGSCNSRERKYAKQDAFNILNTIDKMAQKRALVAATLLLGFSDTFTQDVEDMGAQPNAPIDAAWDDPSAPIPELPPMEEASGLSKVKQELAEALLAWPADKRDQVVQKCSAIIEDGKPVVKNGKTLCVESLDKMLSDRISDKWAGATLAKVRDMRERIASQKGAA